MLENQFSNLSRSEKFLSGLYGTCMLYLTQTRSFKLFAHFSPLKDLSYTKENLKGTIIIST